MTTEHFDLANPVTKVDDIPDYEMYSQTIDSLNKRFGNRLFDCTFQDRKSTRLNSSHLRESRMPSSA